MFHFNASTCVSTKGYRPRDICGTFPVVPALFDARGMRNGAWSAMEGTQGLSVLGDGNL